jgi:hypothetical protein
MIIMAEKLILMQLKLNKYKIVIKLEIIYHNKMLQMDH